MRLFSGGLVLRGGIDGRLSLAVSMAQLLKGRLPGGGATGQEMHEQGHHIRAGEQRSRPA